MKILVISDIHANLTALQAVLADAAEFQVVWCLGDVTGYGPDPNECVELLRTLPNLTCLTGNHDQAVLHRIDLFDFNEDARLAVMWTETILSKNNIAFLSSLTNYQVMGDYTLVHASPRYPVWEYILDIHTARANFNHFLTNFCFVGHTHLPALFQKKNHHHVSVQPYQTNQWIPLSDKMIINPGSVGQPRDYNPMAAYLLLDPLERLIQFRRVSYDIASVQNRMEKANLPKRHILRLSSGY